MQRVPEPAEDSQCSRRGYGGRATWTTSLSVRIGPRSPVPRSATGLEALFPVQVMGEQHCRRNHHTHVGAT